MTKTAAERSSVRPHARRALLAMNIAALGACGSAGHPASSSRALYATTPPAPAQVAIVIPPPPRRYARPSAPPELVAAVDQLWRGFVGKAGIAVRAVDEGWTVESGARQRLPQQSVSKLWVALTVLDRRDEGRLRLDDPITVRREDLTLFHQPIAALVRANGEYQTTVGDLLDRALTHSDNTANDRLLTLVGGSGAVRSLIERKQLGAIRFGPGERIMQSRTAGLEWQPSYAIGNNFQLARDRLSPSTRARALDAYVANPPDGAEPLAIADALARLARGDLLSASSTRLLLDMMGMSVTGRSRLRAALPQGWQIAHKTGTGQDLDRRNAGFNDVGLLTSPDGRRFAIAVMIGDSTRSVVERQRLIQSVAAAVARYTSEGHGQGYSVGL